MIIMNKKGIAIDTTFLLIAGVIAIGVAAAFLFFTINKGDESTNRSECLREQQLYCTQVCNFGKDEEDSDEWDGHTPEGCDGPPSRSQCEDIINVDCT